MSDSSDPRPSSPWSPAAATIPPVSPSPSSPPAGAYPSAGSPPLAGDPWSPPTPGSTGGVPPTWPPSPQRPAPGGPAGPAVPPPSARGRSSGSGRGRTIVAVAAMTAILAGAAGGAVGVAVSRDDGGSTASSATAPATQTVSTQVAPLSGDAAEPAAAVAAALGPAVVQLETQAGLGSGFIYDASGLILTASHVTEGAQTVQVRLADGTRLQGRVVGSDPSTDVAVVKIDPPKDMAVATLATGVKVEVGQTAIAIGSPFGLDQTVTEGIVSAVGRSAETPGGVIPAIQTDAPINSGNSGGALADRKGRVIGINDSIATGGSGSTGNLGIGFAIPIDIAKDVADRIVAGQSTKAGFLGIEGADASGAHAGAAVTSVSPGSPAAKAGLTSDDVVTAVDGTRVSSMLDLAAAIRTHAPGQQVTLTVLRNGAERTVTVTLTAAASN